MHLVTTHFCQQGERRTAARNANTRLNVYSTAQYSRARWTSVVPKSDGFDRSNRPSNDAARVRFGYILDVLTTTCHANPAVAYSRTPTATYARTHARTARARETNRANTAAGRRPRDREVVCVGSETPRRTPDHRFALCCAACHARARTVTLTQCTTVTRSHPPQHACRCCFYRALRYVTYSNGCSKGITTPSVPKRF